MKSLKIMAASLLAVASFASAFADVNLKVTGSTAFRKAFYFACVNSINNPKIACIGGKTDATDMSGANRAVITGTGKVGTAYAGQNVTIQCGFAGSIGGITALVTPSSTIPLSGFTNVHTWMSASNAAASGASVANSGTGKITGYVNFTSETGVAFDAAAFPTVAMSDSFITSTPVTGTLTASEDNPTTGVGIVGFDWDKGQNAPTAPAGYARLTNVTTLQANLLLAAGELPLSFFTGNSADTGVDVLFVGRNNDSGTRLDTEAEADYGFGFNTESQYQPTFNGSNLINGVTFVGDAGYNGGGSVATALATVQAAGAVDDVGNPFIFVSYLGKGDTATVKAANANCVLTFNGIKYDQADDMIRYGAYSGWSYEHMLYTATDTATVKNKSLASDIAARILSTDAVQGGVVAGTMHVSRLIEGGVISP